MLINHTFSDCLETLGRVPIDVVKLIMRMLVLYSGPVLLTGTNGWQIANKLNASYIHCSANLKWGTKEAALQLFQDCLGKQKQDESKCAIF